MAASGLCATVFPECPQGCDSVWAVRCHTLIHRRYTFAAHTLAVPRRGRGERRNGDVHRTTETRPGGRQLAKYVSYLGYTQTTDEEGGGHSPLPRRTPRRVWREQPEDIIALAAWNRDKIMDAPLQVTVHPPQRPVAAGDTVRVALHLADAGAGGTYQLAVRGLADDWYILEQPRVVLGPGAWADVSLTIRPPATHGRHAETYAVTIEARAVDETLGHGSATFPLSVAPLRGLGLDITPVQATGATMTMEAVVVNAQEEDTLVGVVVTGPPGIAARVDPPGYAWAPREGTRRFVVHVGATGARVGAGTYDLTVSALIQGLSVAPGVTRRVRFDYRPRGARRVLYPIVALAARRGVVYAFLAALLALGLGLVAADTGVFGPSAPTAAGVPLTTFPSPTVSGAATVSAADDPLAGLASGPPPRVVRFEARVTAGGTAVVSWSVRDAFLVRLDGTSVPARGEQAFALAGPRTVLLRADGDGGTVIRRLRLAPPAPRGLAVHHVGATHATTVAPRVTATVTTVGPPPIVQHGLLAVATRTPDAPTVPSAPASARQAVARATVAHAAASPRPPDQGAASTHARRRVRPRATRARRAPRHLPAAAVREARPTATTGRGHARRTSPSLPSLTRPTVHTPAPTARATATAHPQARRVSRAPRRRSPRPTPRPTTRGAGVPGARRQTRPATATPTGQVISVRRRVPTPLPPVTPTARASATLIPAPTRTIPSRRPAVPAQRPTPTSTPVTAAIARAPAIRPTASNTARPTATRVTDRRAIPTTTGRPAPSHTPSDIGAPRPPIRAATTATSTPRPTATSTSRGTGSDPRPTPTSAPRVPIHATTTPTNTPRSTVTPTSTPRSTVTPTSTPRPTATPTDSPTATPTDSPTPTSTPAHGCKHDSCHPR